MQDTPIQETPTAAQVAQESRTLRPLQLLSQKLKIVQVPRLYNIFYHMHEVEEEMHQELR